METTHNSVKVKLGIKVMKLVESLIGREVIVGQGSECHLTFVRGLLHIAQQVQERMVSTLREKGRDLLNKCKSQLGYNLIICFRIQ